ncbi:MAG: GTPase Era [Acidimicrobiales bacterium]
MAAPTKFRQGTSASPEPGPKFRSGFATLLGRPNVGKSTLLNRICATKVSIVSDKPNTTRSAVRGVLGQPDAQCVWVDTPGIHRPQTLLGERLNAAAMAAASQVDVVVVVLDAAAGLGGGDRFVAGRVPPNAIVALNKVDLVGPAAVLSQLAAAGRLGLDEYFPVSALTGEGVGALTEAVLSRLPEGPEWYPAGTVTDVPEAFWVAELVREQLLAAVRDELPHSIACRVTEWEWPRIRCEILVERESQRPIVIGRGGATLKAVGTAVRAQLGAGAYLELFVKVDRDWQRRPASLNRLGY